MRGTAEGMNQRSSSLPSRLRNQYSESNIPDATEARVHLSSLGAKPPITAAIAMEVLNKCVRGTFGEAGLPRNQPGSFPSRFQTQRLVLVWKESAGC